VSERRKQEIGVGLLVIAAAAVMAWMSIKIGAVKGGGAAIEVEAIFEDVTGLQVGALVTVAGVEVGQVERLDVDFDRARVALSIQEDRGVREDVQVRIRARSLLGEKYVALIPRGREAPPLADGAVLTDTVSQVELTDVVTRLEPLLSALEGDRLGRLVDGLAGALEEDPERLGRILADAEAAVGNLKSASDAAPEVVAEGRAAVAELRGALARARPMLERADGILVDLAPAAEAAGAQGPKIAEDAEATLAEARALAELLGGEKERLERILKNVEAIDKWELRRLLREEGIVVRLREKEVVPDAQSASD